MESQTPWMGEYVWEENKCDGSEPHCVPLPDEVIAMFRPSKCLLCGTVTNNQQSAFTHYESKGHFKKVAQHMREKYNVLGTLKSKEKFRPVRCEVCQIDIMSRIVLMQHYEGKQHLKNLQKKSDGAAGVTEVRDAADTPTATGGGDFENPLDFLKDLPPPPPLPKLGIYFCSLCQMKTKSKAQMEIHNNGSRHLKNLSKLADGELKEFFLRNGNCEPVEPEGQDSTPPSTPASDDQVSPFPPPGGPPVAGYGYPPMGMPMMSPSSYPPMPYGQYPQYPMGYDYNSWNQGQQGYNAGPPPYNAQQQYGQMYNSGPYSYPYNQQQYNANQQQYPDNQQQYPGNQPPFLPGPPSYVPQQTFNDPCPAAPGTTDTPVSMGDDTFSTPNTSDKRITSPKDPEVRESPLPDDFEIKPLAVSNFIKLLAQETKLEKASNNPPTNPPVPVVTADSGIIGSALEGDSANPAAEVEYSPGQLDDSAKSDVESVGIEGAVYPTGIADNGSDVTAAEDVGEIHKQGEANDTYKLDGASKSSSYSGGSEEDESANSRNKIKDESDVTQKRFSDEIREHKSDQNEHGQFVATGFTETNVQVSLEPPAEKASSTTTDAFKFKMSVNTVGKPKVNSFFRRSTEKMFKEAKEKKRLEELQKLKESYIEAPSAESSTDIRTNVGAKTFDMSDNSHPIPDPIEYIPKNPEKQKFDKSDGEISDDVSAVLSSGQPQDSSVPKVSDSAKNSLGDNVDGQEKDKKDCDKNEQVQNDTKINSEKQKSSKKKFSASDKKKVFRTRNSSSDESKKSRSRSRSRRRRSGKQRSSSWNPSSEDESKTHDYHGKSDYVQDNYHNYYGYNNRNRNWRNNRGYYNNRGFHHRNYWDHQRYSWDNQEDYYERDVEETDEFGREKRRREDKKKDKRESRKRKKEKRSSSVVSFSSRSSSGSRSRSRKTRRKSDKKEKSKKTPLPSPDVKTKKTMKTPETPVERLISNVSQADTKQTPLTLAQKLRLDKSDRIRERDLEEKKELNAEVLIVEDDSVSTANPARLVAKAMPPEREESDQVVVANKKESHQKPNIPSELLQVLEKEREKQEILKKMALIKMKLEQKEKDKPVKKKKKKEKSKNKKKKRSSSTSSSSSSSSSSSDSSSSSNSSSSSSQNESLAEKLLAKMKKEAKGPGPSSVLPDLAKVLPLLKKNEPEAASKKKKRKKDKKAKKKKKGKSRKDEPSPSTLAAYVTPSGTYYCKYCNSSFVTGNSFIEHFLSQKHKLMYKLVKEKA